VQYGGFKAHDSVPIPVVEAMELKQWEKNNNETNKAY
jgi:hypothetical protein